MTHAVFRRLCFLGCQVRKWRAVSFESWRRRCHHFFVFRSLSPIQPSASRRAPGVSKRKHKKRSLQLTLFLIGRNMKPARPVTFSTLHENASRYIHAQKADKPNSVHPRSLVLKIGVLVGELCSSMLSYAPPLDNSGHEFWDVDSEEKNHVARAMGRLLFCLCIASQVCEIDLHTAIHNKMELNGRKYPVELCKGKSGKYTMYSNQTGITKKTGQSTARSPSVSPTKPTTGDEEDSRKLSATTAMIREFAMARSWYKYHTPRNVLLALMGETGELAECFQWKGDDFEEDLFSEDERDHASHEFADIAIYLLRMADVCQVDIGHVALHESKKYFLE